MLPKYYDYIFVHRRQKARTSHPRIKLQILSTLGPNPAQNQTRPEKPSSTFNFELANAIQKKSSLAASETKLLGKRNERPSSLLILYVYLLGATIIVFAFLRLLQPTLDPSSDGSSCNYKSL